MSFKVDMDQKHCPKQTEPVESSSPLSRSATSAEILEETKSSTTIQDCSFEEIELLLRADGFISGPQMNLPKTQEQHEYYFNPLATLSLELFFQDSLDYLRVKKGGIHMRRVCFLLKVNATPIVCILFCTKPNIQVAQTLYQQIEVASMSDEKLIRDASIQAGLAQLYRQKAAVLLGVTSPEVIQQINQILSQTSASNTRIMTKVPIESEAFPLQNLALWEYARAILCFNGINEFNFKLASERAHAIGQAAFSAQLITLQGRTPLFKTIIEKFDLVVKYRILDRQRQSEVNEKKHSYLDYCELHQQDAKRRTILFYSKFKDAKSSQDSIEIACSWLDLATVLKFLGAVMQSSKASFAAPAGDFADAAQKLLTCLQADYIERGQIKQAWEDNLQRQIAAASNKDRGAYLTYQVKQGLTEIYQSSWLNFGGNLLAWMGQRLELCFRRCKRTAPVKVSAPISGLASQRLSDAALATSSSTVVTIEPKKNTTRSVKQMIQRVKISSREEKLHWFGAGLGLCLHYYIGWYDFIRMLAIVMLSKHLMRYWQIYTGDEKAKWQVPSEHLSHFLHVNNALLTAIEALYLTDLRPLMLLGGAMVGSFVSTETARAIIPSLRSDSLRRFHPDQIYALFIIALGGGYVGRQILSYCTYVVIPSYEQRLEARYATKAALIYARSQLQQPAGVEIQDLQVELPPLSMLDVLVDTQRNPIQISWTSGAGIKQAVSCLIYGPPTRLIDGFRLDNLVCDQIAVDSDSSMLRLTPP